MDWFEDWIAVFEIDAIEVAAAAAVDDDDVDDDYYYDYYTAECDGLDGCYIG